MESVDVWLPSFPSIIIKCEGSCGQGAGAEDRASHRGMRPSNACDTTAHTSHTTSATGAADADADADNNTDNNTDNGVDTDNEVGDDNDDDNDAAKRKEQHRLAIQLAKSSGRSGHVHGVPGGSGGLAGAQHKLTSLPTTTRRGAAAAVRIMHSMPAPHRPKGRAPPPDYTAPPAFARGGG